MQKVNPLTTNDEYSRHRNSAACYQLAQSVLKIGSALAERVGQGEVGQGEVGQGEVGQGEVGGATAVADHAWRLLQLAIAVADHAWRLLQLAIEKARSALDGPLFCFLVQTGVENGPSTL